jgi:hypothetical protein
MSNEDSDEDDEIDQTAKDIEKYGIRKYAAMLLMRKGEKALSQYLTKSEIEELRKAANGPRL